MNRTRLRQLIWRLATQIYRNCHRTWLRQHNWWNGDVSNFPTLAKNIEQRREVHRIGQQNSISAFLHLLNLMYGGVNQRFPSNGNLIERGSPKIEASCKSYLMSSVGSSYSHPDLLLIHHHQQIFHACMGMTCALIWQILARIWHTLSLSGTHFVIFWHTLSFSGILLHTLTYSIILWHTLAYSSKLWYTLAYTGILWYALAYSVILCHTLAYYGMFLA